MSALPRLSVFPWYSRVSGSLRGWTRTASPSRIDKGVDYRMVQVVRAEQRGDLCHYAHALDKNSSIDTTAVRGPFDTAEAALEAFDV